MGILTQYNSQFEGVEVAEGGKFEELPPGDYEAVIKSVRIKEGTKKGPMFSLEFRVVGPANFANRTHWSNYFFDSEGALKMLKLLFRILHKSELLPGDLEDTAVRASFSGLRVKFEIEDKEFKGKLYRSTFVKKLLDASTPNAAEPPKQVEMMSADEDADLPF